MVHHNHEVTSVRKHWAIQKRHHQCLLWHCCYQHCCENFFPRFCLYFRHIRFDIPSNGYFYKVNKNFKSIGQPNTQFMLQKNLLKILIVRYCFDSAKCFLINYSHMCCVTSITASFYVFRVNKRHEIKTWNLFKYYNMVTRMT